MASRKNKLAFRAFIAIVVIAVLEIGSGISLKKDPDADKLRRHIVHKNNTDYFPRITAYPYLNYTCTPRYSEDGVQHHNEDGYRGPRIPLRRTDNVFRILFLGGSTTYSIGADGVESTFPEQTAAALREKTGLQIEVINGGLPFGTSAELLLHYQFRYRYYQSDLVVINTGGNDAFSYIIQPDLYQPDYNHWRGSFEELPRMNMLKRNLMRSRFIGLVAVRTSLSKFISGSHYVHHGQGMKIDWFESGSQFQGPLNNAFYNNISTLVHEIKRDSAAVLMVPFAPNMEFKDYPNSEPDYLTGIELHNYVLYQLAVEQQLGFSDFSAADISDPNLWMDDCHLLPEGIKIKAGVVADEIVQFLEEKSN